MIKIYYLWLYRALTPKVIIIQFVIRLWTMILRCNEEFALTDRRQKSYEYSMHQCINELGFFFLNK